MSSSNFVKIALGQINVVVGDLVGNAKRIVETARRAHAAGAALFLTPELALTGYPPEDLILRPAFMKACAAALEGIALALADCKGLHVVVGHPVSLNQAPDVRSKSLSLPAAGNAASVLFGGKVQATYLKRQLPNYQVFDERRYFTSGQELGEGAVVFDVRGVKFGLLICEDAWFEEPAQLAKAAGAQALCVLNASPFHQGKQAEREARMARRAQAVGLPLFYCHLVGGQDEVVFDGSSFSMTALGEVAARAPGFREDLLMVTLDVQGGLHGELNEALGEEAQVWEALVLGVRDYVEKNGFPGALIGLSGGVDSALVLALAVDALGVERVRAVMMPSAYTAEISWLDARDMARYLGVRYDEIGISPMFDAFRLALSGQFAGLPEDATEENIQARVRGTLLMALSNKTGFMVLTTGNKSEMATGYCTLYGDMAGGFAVIKDVAKTMVYRLAHWKNSMPSLRADGSVGPVIPERILSRPPSAELRPDQTDQDSLPPYEILDAIVSRYMEDDWSVEDLVAAGFGPAHVEQVVRLIRTNEYKRRQAPVGIRITHRAFGRDWRYPITSKFRA